MLGNMFRFSAHDKIDKVCVARKVELIGFVNPDAAVLEQFGERTVDNCCADLTFPVVAQYRDAGFFAFSGNLWIRGDEFGDTINHAALCLLGTIYIEADRIMGAGWQVNENYIDLIIDQRLRDINRLLTVIDGEIVLTIIIAQVLGSAVQHRSL